MSGSIRSRMSARKSRARASRSRLSRARDGHVKASLAEIALTISASRGSSSISRMRSVTTALAIEAGRYPRCQPGGYDRGNGRIRWAILPALLRRQRRLAASARRLAKRRRRPGPPAPSGRSARFRSRRDRWSARQQFAAALLRAAFAFSRNGARSRTAERTMPRRRSCCSAVASTSIARWRTIRSARSSAVAALERVGPAAGAPRHGAPKPWLEALLDERTGQAGDGRDRGDEQCAAQARGRSGRYFNVGLSFDGLGVEELGVDGLGVHHGGGSSIALPGGSCPSGSFMRERCFSGFSAT